MTSTSEMIPVKGEVELTIRHADGTSETRSGPNLVTTLGQNMIAALLTGGSDVPTHMACGSSNLTPTKAMTALQGTEHERVAVSDSVVNNVVTLSAEFGSGIGSDVLVGEFGLFNAASSGTMFARWVTVSFTLPQTSTISVNWRLTIGG